MKGKELLTETPQLIPPLDAADIAAAIDDCLKNVNRAKVTEKFDDDAALYELKLKGSSYFFVYNKQQTGTKKIEYFVRFRDIEFDHSLAPTKSIRQVLLWRNKSVISAYSVEMAKKVFWEHLFPRYRCLASDSQQTEDAVRFWSSAISTALSKGLTVRIVNTNDKTFVDVRTKKEFNARISTTWGTARWFQRMVVVIFE